jgi:hypothetical protein
MIPRYGNTVVKTKSKPKPMAEDISRPLAAVLKAGK